MATGELTVIKWTTDSDLVATMLANEMAHHDLEGAAMRVLPELEGAFCFVMADERSVFNGRLVDAFTNIMSVKLFDSGRREHAYVRDGLESFLAAVVRGQTSEWPPWRPSVLLESGKRRTRSPAFWRRGIRMSCQSSGRTRQNDSPLQGSLPVPPISGKPPT